jgi:hypothetical protein
MIPEGIMPDKANQILEELREEGKQQGLTGLELKNSTRKKWAELCGQPFEPLTPLPPSTVVQPTPQPASMPASVLPGGMTGAVKIARPDSVQPSSPQPTPAAPDAVQPSQTVRPPEAVNVGSGEWKEKKAPDVDLQAAINAAQATPPAPKRTAP